MSDVVPPTVPYRGILPFRYADRTIFYGREAVVTDLLAKVLVSRVVVLFGESGSGKSSLINAGLVPALIKEGLHPERILVRPISEEPFLVEQIVKGEDESGPFLPSIFFDAAQWDSAGAGRHLSCSMDRFREKVRQATSYPVLMFDQFEELFTLFGQEPATAAKEEALRREVFEQIFQVVNDSRLRVKVLLIMREDFLGKLELLAHRYPPIFDYRLLLRPLDQDEARRAILGPFKDPNPYSARLVPDLAESVIADLSKDRPDALIPPTQLQIVCRRLWEKYVNSSPEITVEEYKKEDCVQGILTSFLESELGKLDVDLQRPAVIVLGHLITGAGTRDVVSLDKLARLNDNEPIEHQTVLPVLNELEQRRLVNKTYQRDTAYYEIASEYLIPPIRQKKHEFDLQREREEAEKAAVDRAKAAAQKQEAVIMRLRFVVAALLAFIALVAVVVLTRNWLNTQKERSVYHAKLLAAYADANLGADTNLSLWLAQYAVRATHDNYKTVTKEAEAALHRAIQVSYAPLTLSGYSASIEEVAFSPDGKHLATGSADGTAKVWDAASGDELLALDGHTAAIKRVAYSPDGSRLTTVSADGTVSIWDATSGLALLTLIHQSATILDMAYSPDGSRLATVSADGTVKVWNASSGAELRTLTKHDSPIHDIAYSPSGRRLVAACADKTVRVWDATSGAEILTLTGHTDAVNGVTYSPDGKRLATASSDGTAKVWDATSGAVILTLPGHFGEVNGVAYSPDGKRLATAGGDGTAQVWDATSGQGILPLTGHTNAVNGIVFSPDGKRLATVGADGTVKIWSSPSSHELVTPPDHGSAVNGVAYSPNGQQLATAGADGTAKVRDAASGAEMLVMAGHSGAVNAIVYSPEGERLATAGADGTARVWDAASGVEILTLIGHAGAVNDVAYSPDGKQLATAGADGTAKVWDAASGVEILALIGHAGAVNGVARSPDGKQLATASDDGTVRVWDATSGAETVTLDGHTGAVRGVAFSPDGRRLATACPDGTVQVWVWDATTDTHDTEAFILSDHADALQALVFSPDGKLLATGSINGAVRTYVLGIDELMALAERSASRFLTSEQCLKYLKQEWCISPP